MQMYYSATTGGFYSREVHGDALPADASPISDALYDALRGKQIEAGPDGLPREKWIEVGVSVPRSVTMRQARLALLRAGVLQAVDAAIAGLPSQQREAAQIEWEFAATVDRDSDTTALLAAGLGMTDKELDQLFTLAATF